MKLKHSGEERRGRAGAMTKREVLALFLRVLAVFYETGRVFTGGIDKLREELRQEIARLNS